MRQLINLMKTYRIMTINYLKPDCRIHGLVPGSGILQSSNSSSREEVGDLGSGPSWDDIGF